MNENRKPLILFTVIIRVVSCVTVFTYPDGFTFRGKVWSAAMNLWIFLRMVIYERGYYPRISFTV